MKRGPFVALNLRLPLIFISDRKKTKASATRAIQKEIEPQNKKNNAAIDTCATRGIYTEQGIDIENLNARKVSLVDR